MQYPLKFPTYFAKKVLKLRFKIRLPLCITIAKKGKSSTGFSVVYYICQNRLCYASMVKIRRNHY